MTKLNTNSSSNESFNYKLISWRRRAKYSHEWTKPEPSLYLELGPDGDELLLQLACAQVKHVQHERELDVLQDLGVDRVSLLELKPDHLDGEVAREPANLHLFKVGCVAAEGLGMLGHRFLKTLMREQRFKFTPK